MKFVQAKNALVSTAVLYLLVSAAIAVIFPAFGHAGTWVPFGPKNYVRGTGAPVTVTDTFTLLNPATQYTLKAFNGGLQDNPTELVASSVVTLNGVQVVGPGNFNQNVTEVNVPINPQLVNTISVQVRGRPGGVLAIEIVGVDNDPPIISASISPLPNAAGWNNSNVTVSFTCSDKTSGVAFCPAPISLTTEGANQVISGTAMDLAGNAAMASVTVNLDETPPNIFGVINPPPDAAGYNSSAVTVNFTCTDAISGVASCSLPVSISNEGTTQVPGMVTDIAGNAASVIITVNISFNYFKIQSWQTGSNGNTKSASGKCLDYGTSPTGNGAAVFLNDCSSAHPIRMYEITPPRTQQIPMDNQGNTTQALNHEVMLFAGNDVIGIHNPQTISLGATSSPSAAPPEYSLELQVPWNSSFANTMNSNPANQIFRLDGDSIILEGSYYDPRTNVVNPGPCVNTVNTVVNAMDPTKTLCPDPSPEVVIQVQKSRGANGSPLVAAVRNLSDNEFWDFVPQGARPYPTSGFVSTLGGQPINTNWQLWNAICANPTATSAGATVFSDPNASNYGQPVPCLISNVGWGSIVVVTSPNNDCMVTDPVSMQMNDIGACIDLSGFAPLVIPAGATIRGDRRGIHAGPQLYAGYSHEWGGLPCDGTCIMLVAGDYARVSGLHVRGQSRSIGEPSNSASPIVDGIVVEPAGTFPNPPNATALGTVTELIATVDHNEMSDWITGAIRADSPFGVNSKAANQCQYPGFGGWYTCDQYNQLVPYPGTSSSCSCGVPVTNDAATLGNVFVAHNFLHHNSSQNTGYGVEMGNSGGRYLAEGNTFSWARHNLTGSGEPHAEYHALNNLVMSGAPVYSNPFIGRLQDFDMHGTDNPSTYVGGAGGYNVLIAGNSFLAHDGHDYLLRGYPDNYPSPIDFTQYYGNVSRRNEDSAIQFVDCVLAPFCTQNYNGTPFPIVISNSQFGQSTPDPTSTLGVGDFDGDGNDDLFLATGAGWYYSPGGVREWRYLNSARDTIDQLLLGDFDGDGRTDVVGLRSGQLFVSWGGISAFELLNSSVPANCTMADMAVGDFDGDGKADIFCADWRNMTWWISYGGNTTFAAVNKSDFQRKDLRFGDFNHDGATDVFSVQSNGWYVSYNATGLWANGFLQGPLTSTADGLVVADFNGDGSADVGMPCSSGGLFGAGASPGWQISYGGTQSWSACNTFASGLTNQAGCALINTGLPSPPCINIANGAVGRFSGGRGSDIVLWSQYNSQGAANLLDMPSGTGAPYQLSATDVDMH